MKKLTTIFFILFAFTLNAQIPHFVDETIPINGRVYLNNQPFTGLLVDMYPNKSHKLEENYKNGYLDGKNIKWYPNGKKQEEGYYSKGIPEGKQLYWYENGKNKEEIFYSNQKANGKHTLWYENGQIHTEKNFVDSVLDGVQRLWYENGQKMKEETFWLGNEQKKIEWHSNGIKQCEINYVEGKVKDGDYIFTDENNKPYTVTYAKGYMTKKKFNDGRFEDFYENGQKKDEGKLNEKDHIDGVFTAWWENGNKRSQGIKIDGKLEGHFMVWFENGKINSESTFKNNLLEGESIQYDENGQKTVLSYENGNVIKRESKKEENRISKISRSGNELLFYCISGSDNDTSFIKLTLDNANYNDKYKSQIISRIMSYMSNRFHQIGNVEDLTFRNGYVNYFYELSGVNYSTNNVSYKSKCVDKSMKVYDCVKNGYTATCQYKITLRDANQTILYTADPSFKTTDDLFQGEVYSDNVDDAIYKVSKKANSQYAVYHYFPIKAYISDLKKVRGDANVKTVVISVGSDLGLYEGLKFSVLGDDSWASDNTIAELRVTDIYPTTANCKVVSGGEGIFKKFNSSSKVKIISNR